MEFQSTRERIVEILRRTQRPLRVEEIAMILGLEPSRKREIYEHLTHIAKTTRLFEYFEYLNYGNTKLIYDVISTHSRSHQALPMTA